MGDNLPLETDLLKQPYEILNSLPETVAANRKALADSVKVQVPEFL